MKRGSNGNYESPDAGERCQEQKLKSILNNIEIQRVAEKLKWSHSAESNQLDLLMQGQVSCREQHLTLDTIFEFCFLSGLFSQRRFIFLILLQSVPVI